MSQFTQPHQKNSFAVRVAPIPFIILGVVLLAFLFSPMVELLMGTNPNSFSVEPEVNTPLALVNRMVYKLTADVIPNETITQLTLRFGTYQRINKGFLIVQLCEDDEVVSSWRVDTKDLGDYQGRSFPLDTPYTIKEGSEYTIKVVDTYRGTNGVALFMDSTRPEGYYVNGKYNPGGCICHWFDYAHSRRRTFVALLITFSAIALVGYVLISRRLLPKRMMKPAMLYMLICVIALSVLMGVFSLAKSDPWLNYFFRPSDVNFFRYADTGMDHFNSVQYILGNDPYGQFGTIYPPLANLVYKVFYHLAPQSQKDHWVLGGYGSTIFLRRSEYDLRAWMPTLLPFLAFIAGVTLLTYMIIVNHNGLQLKGLLALMITVNYGYLYAVERGNIILLSMVTLLFYVAYYDSPRRCVRELALISLAISANIKLYPALFGVMLLYDRCWKEAVRAVIYGILLFVLPCLAFKNGLNNVVLCFNNIKGFIGGLSLDNTGTSFDKIVCSIYRVCYEKLGISFPFDFYFKTMGIIDRALLPVCVACGLLLPKKWQKCLCCTLGMILFSNQGIYVMAFFAVPTAMFFKEEIRFTPANIAPFIGFTLCMACLPVFNDVSDGFSFLSFRLQLGELILLVYMIVETIRTLAAKRRRSVKAL